MADQESRTGGVDITESDATVGGDIVGRDKLEADGNIIYAEAGATVTVSDKGRGFSITGLLNELSDQAGIPSDMPFHEKIGNLLMFSLGQLDESSLATIMHLLALLFLSAGFAWWLVQSEPLWSEALWKNLGITWLGLTILPLLASTLPQQRERDLRKNFQLSLKQKIALRLEKAMGGYIGAYLGEIATIIVWLSLYYLGLWGNMPLIFKTVFWLILELITFTLSFVGAVIAVKYWENLLRASRATNLQTDHFLLGLGFPTIVYPSMALFGLLTLPLWKQWQTGCLLIAFVFLSLTWLLRREARKESKPDSHNHATGTQ